MTIKIDVVEVSELKTVRAYKQNKKTICGYVYAPKHMIGKRVIIGVIE